MTLNSEEAFHEECWNAIEECKALRYNPTAWVAMINKHGATSAARRLLESGEIQPGFDRLVKMGKIDLTVEFAVLNPKWERLFDRSHREAAWWRLAEAFRQS